MSGRSGYQLHPTLTVDVQSHLPQSVTSDSLGETPEDRQNWILSELKAGRKLRRTDLEKKFGISLATAKRDFTILNDQVAFAVAGSAGH